MKRSLIATLSLGAALAASPAFSGDLQCFVDTPAFDQFTSGGCFNAGTAFTTTVLFKVVPSGGTVSDIIWSGDAAHQCSGPSTFCSIGIRQYQNRTAGATVLYTNGTFEVIPAITARYEGFF